MNKIPTYEEFQLINEGSISFLETTKDFNSRYTSDSNGVMLPTVANEALQLFATEFFQFKDAPGLKIMSYTDDLKRILVKPFIKTSFAGLVEVSPANIDQSIVRKMKTAISKYSKEKFKFFDVRFENEFIAIFFTEK